MAENRPRFPLYLHIALAQVSFILGSFGILGYMIYGGTVPQIVTDKLQTGIVAQLVRFTLIIAVMMTYPLQLYPVIEIAESVLFTKIHSKSKSHLGAVIAGPSMDPDSNPVSPVDSNSIDSHYPVSNSPDDLSTSVNSETQVLIPKETDELQFKVQLYSEIANYHMEQIMGIFFNLFHPKINMHILHTVFYEFPKVLIRRICLTINNSCTC